MHELLLRGHHAGGVDRAQAAANGLKARTQLLVTPGSEQVRATIERDGLLADLEAIGAEVLANACGPCIGQWERTDLDPGQLNTIVNSYNRNFPKRNDGNANTLAFVTSPDTVLALALAGTLAFDPTTDTLTNDRGEEVRLEAPVGEVLPDKGFDPGDSGFIAPPADGSVAVVVEPTSERLQLLEPFPAGTVRTTSARGPDEGPGQVHDRSHLGAGKWLRYRGHLENISGLFLGAVNALTGATGEGKDQTTARPARTRDRPPVPRGRHRWCAIGDENYGEGSSCEHAAMEPRFRNGKVIFARSFARIHETNLKKQGLVPLTFADPATYDLIGEDDRINVLGLADLTPDRPVRCQIVKPDGTTIDFLGNHTFSEEQIEWFRLAPRSTS